MSFILLLVVVFTVTPAYAVRSRTRPAPKQTKQTKPKLAQINCQGAQHGLVFATRQDLYVYCEDNVTVGEPIPLRAFVNSGRASLVPNGTKVQILSTTLQFFPRLGAKFVEIRLREGYWHGKDGFILWEELAALPSPPKPQKKK